MTRRTFAAATLAVAILLALSTQPVLAQTETEAYFDAATQSVVFSIGNAADTIFDIHVLPSGCVDTLTGTVHLTGPADTGSVDLTCAGPNSGGTVAVQFCRGAVCFKTIYITMGCKSDCTLYAVSQVPALNIWGMIALVVLLGSASIWLIRRRRLQAE
jgi:hypothetical protein